MAPASIGSRRRSPPETNPTLGAVGRDVYFVRDNNVYSLALDGGLTRQLTDIRTSARRRGVDDGRRRGPRSAVAVADEAAAAAVRARTSFRARAARMPT